MDFRAPSDLFARRITSKRICTTVSNWEDSRQILVQPRRLLLGQGCELRRPK